MPRKVSKRSYRKRPQKARRSRKRFYRRRFYKRNPIKKPEIHISSDNIEFSHSGLGNGLFQNITLVSGAPFSDVPSGGDNDLMRYQINGKQIEGRKIRLKYLYIKGYLYSEDNNINGKLYIFRRKKNASNTALSWSSLMDLPINLSSPGSWSTEDINDILYKYDWKNDLNGQIKKKVKMIYKSYDNNNNYIPFKIRIPLYDCVLTCDSSWDTFAQKWVAVSHPSTNGLYISYITNANMGEGSTHALKLKYKLYYTDY